jgi:hypothetical protein
MRAELHTRHREACRLLLVEKTSRFSADIWMVAAPPTGADEERRPEPEPPKERFANSEAVEPSIVEGQYSGAARRLAEVRVLQKLFSCLESVAAAKEEGKLSGEMPRRNEKLPRISCVIDLVDSVVG